ncbi:hypothetical protein [Bradyrhizobium sp. ARR65]|uniref:hypothetical protein n=1 Tax=Bradyrhizobium sp. ARR65 TaxID=1040989 RepID=UPI000467DBC2|nr:hypothetical protein [Bradyrhizobium sp. ARR65]
MSWFIEFDEPIELGKGKPLCTLRDAANYITALPRAVAELEHWQTAIACLIAAAEKRGIVMRARIAMMQAPQAGKPQPAPPPRS